MGKSSWNCRKYATFCCSGIDRPDMPDKGKSGFLYKYLNKMNFFLKKAGGGTEEYFKVKIRKWSGAVPDGFHNKENTHEYDCDENQHPGSA
ncbi:MAG: hypothetical protein MI863_15135 [Desulfobacterales bacterium]|nr:hypothetical protein [Desulfobacterales bacterium]